MKIDKVIKEIVEFLEFGPGEESYIKEKIEQALAQYGKDIVGKYSNCADYKNDRPCACDGINQAKKESRKRSKERWGVKI